MRYEVMTRVGGHSSDDCEVFDHQAHPHRQVVCRGKRQACEEIVKKLNEKEKKP